MNKQTLIALSFLILIGAGALWFATSSKDTTAGQAVAAETDATAKVADNAEANPATSNPWSIRCNQIAKPESEETTEFCQIAQRLNEQESGKRFAEFLIGYPAETKGEARGIVILPLGVLLSPGVKMQIDDGKMYQFDYRYCTDIGCVSVIKLTNETIEEMKQGNKAAIQFVSAKGLQINLPITLSGFTKAITDLPK